MVWTGHVEHKDDDGWIRHCTLMEVNRTRHWDHPSKSRWIMWKMIPII